MASVAVLYAKRGSVYHDVPCADVWDEVRDARRYDGRGPVVAHPPCRAWGRYSWKVNEAQHEKDLARHAVHVVRRNGGVLEHPACSKLWTDQNLPRPGEPPDQWDGWTLAVNQVDFGHRAVKPTWLYIVGVKPEDVPIYAKGMFQPVTEIERMWRGEREATPKPFAVWLVHLAHLANGVPSQGA